MWQHPLAPVGSSCCGDRFLWCLHDAILGLQSDPGWISAADPFSYGNSAQNINLNSSVCNLGVVCSMLTPLVMSERYQCLISCALHIAGASAAGWQRMHAAAAGS